jgi:hypothetical protein
MMVVTETIDPYVNENWTNIPPWSRKKKIKAHIWHDACEACLLLFPEAVRKARNAERCRIRKEKASPERQAMEAELRSKIRHLPRKAITEMIGKADKWREARPVFSADNPPIVLTSSQRWT